MGAGTGVNLAVFHYHFLTGGVTTVIRQALRAIRRHLPEVGQIQLVGGRSAEGLANELARERVVLRSVPAIDYRETLGAGPERVAAEARTLAAGLLERFGGPEVVWWIHNHHLGKNPVFTQAILEALQDEPRQRVILQIHDFPEAGRFANLRLLTRSLSLSPYPIGANVRYALLTPRDRAVLLGAGVPESSLFLLGNPVPPVAATTAAGRPPGSAQLRRRLAGAFGAQFPGYDPARPLAVYPVRTIRRKNLFEACLLTALPEAKLALAVTLPGVSRSEKPYSDRVEEAFRSGRCCGLWGVGTRLGSAGLSFEQLLGGADLIVSSAVQEGYGYLFVNALQRRKPLLARDLDILEGTRDLFAGYPAWFYHAVLCPLGKRERRRLRSRYLNKLRGLSDTIPDELLPALAQEIDKTFESEAVEFSYLPVDLQAGVLARLADPGLAGDLRRANPQLAAAIPGLLSLPTPDLGSEIDGRFGLRRYAESFGAILSSFISVPHAGPQADAASIQQSVVRHFARLDYLRLLYD